MPNGNDKSVMIDNNNCETNIYQNNMPNTNKRNINNSRIYVNQNPERNTVILTLPLKDVTRPICNAKYATIARKEKKIAILSASITKPIDMNRFNHLIVNGSAVKRAYGGATVSRLNCYVQAILKEDKPDEIIINAGTNNFTKKRNQTAQETTNEIMEIVKSCHNGGVEKIYVSSITCRPMYQEKVDKVNKLLQQYVQIYNYEFINNADIKEIHLRNDGVHLNNEGIYILADNFLNHINKPSTFSSSSIWD